MNLYDPYIDIGPWAFCKCYTSTIFQTLCACVFEKNKRTSACVLTIINNKIYEQKAGKLQETEIRTSCSAYHHKLACTYQPNEIQSLSCNTPNLQVLVPEIFKRIHVLLCSLRRRYILTRGVKTYSQ